MSTAILLHARKNGLGATDASAVLGLNPWKSALQVWCEKRGLVEDQPQTDAMKWGVIMEPVLAAEYSAVTGKVLIAPDTVYHHPEYDFLLGTPDRLIVGEKRGVEIKTASAYVTQEWGVPGTDQIPQHYLIQCMHYMALTGYRSWDVAVLIGGNDFRIYTVKRDDQLIATLTDRLVAWWQRHMVEGVEPEATALDSDFNGRRFPKNDGTMKAASMTDFSAAADLKRAALALKEAEAAHEEAKARLQQSIGDADGIEGENWRVTWKATKDRAVTDWCAVANALANELSDDAELALKHHAANHTTTKPGSRVFRYWEGK